MAILTDGYQTLITFTSDEISSAVTLTTIMQEQEVTPPGVGGGGPNDTTTMRNETWRTRHPKNLRTLTPMTVIIKYDPALYDEMVAMVNDNQAITITFPDESTLLFWGWIDSFTPNAHVEGDQPTATVVIEPSNMDADNDNEEIDPVYTAAA